MRLFARAIFGLGLLLASMGGAWGEARIALVIGNGGYERAPLANPTRDARLMDETLRAIGFQVSLLVDGDQRAMKRAIRDFGAALRGAERGAVGFFYFAGHGVQADGRNYLIPVGAPITAEADLDLEAVDAQGVLRQMESAGNGVNIVVLDACRNNPFRRSFRSASSGLARMDAPHGSLIGYATAPGDVAEDGSGRNSPYSAALARELRAPGLKLEEAFKRVRIAVVEDTNGRQVPWESSSLLVDFYPAATGGDGGAVVETVEPPRWAEPTVQTTVAPEPKPEPEPREAVSRPVDPPSDPKTEVLVVNPGFDCKLATTPQELIICTDGPLSRANAALGAAYGAARDSLTGAQMREVRNAQRAWIKARDQVCPARHSDVANAAAHAEIAACLTQMTLARVRELEALTR